MADGVREQHFRGQPRAAMSGVFEELLALEQRRVRDRHRTALHGGMAD